MSSFYGGKRGASLEIVKSYDTYDAMIQDQSNIDYNEYVLAKTVETKNNEDVVIKTQFNVLYRRIQTGYQEIAELTVQGTGGGGSGGSDNNTIVSSTSTTKISSFSSIEQYKGKPGYTSGSFLLADCVAPEVKNGEAGSIINVLYNSYILTQTDEEGNSTSETFIGFQIPYPDISLTSSNNSITITPAKDTSNPFKFAWDITTSAQSGGGSTNIANVVYLQNLRVVDVNQISGDAEIYNPVNNDRITITDEWRENRASAVLYDQIKDNVTTTYYFGDYNSIKSFNISDSGLFTITDIQDNIQTYQFTDIDGVELVDGVLSIKYKGGKDTQNIDLIYVTDITFDSDQQKYVLTYSNKTTQVIGEEVNIIEDLVVNENKHLLIYFSSPTYRAEHGTEETYKGKTHWVDYGIVTSDNGLYIGVNFTPDEILKPNDYNLSRTEVIDFLTEKYPNGLTGDNIAGKVVTIGYAEDIKDIYAFDYVNTKWYFLGSVDGSKSSSSEEGITNLGATNFFGDKSLSFDDDIVKNLPNGCTWFVTEEM